MHELNEVFANYLPNSFEASAGFQIRRRLTPGAGREVDQYITNKLPTLFTEFLRTSGRDPSQYRIYGSVGQQNWTLAYIPWVAVLRRDITTSTERGYYVVLLFSQDMSRCFLSLNQGFTQFRKAFGDRMGAKKISQVAALAFRDTTVPKGFVAGKIDLAATTSLGIGYQDGAIVSRQFLAGEEVEQADVAANLAILLNLYDELAGKFGPNLLDRLELLSSDEYQEAANDIASAEPSVDLPAGGIRPPGRRSGQSNGGYKRNPSMAAMAIASANYTCEVDPSHETFTSRRSKKPYVEAHHLIPMQRQVDFEFSLDVPENIVALCPSCHRRFHHARFSEIKNPLHKLF